MEFQRSEHSMIPGSSRARTTELTFLRPQESKQLIRSSCPFSGNSVDFSFFTFTPSALPQIGLLAPSLQGTSSLGGSGEGHYSANTDHKYSKVWLEEHQLLWNLRARPGPAVNLL